MFNRLLIFLLLAMPVVVRGQVNYCVTRTPAFTGITYSNVHDITIDLKTVTTGLVNGIRFNNCYNIHITRSEFKNGNKIALYFVGCHDVLVDYCTFDQVGAGIVFESCGSNCKAQYNQFRNMQGLTPAVSHAIQFNKTNGSGLEATYNKIQSAFSPFTGDLISVYKSNGTPTSRIKINRNFILGGGTDFSFGPAGIILGDIFGDYQEAMDNVLVNTGFAGIQTQGGNHNVVKRDTIFGAVGLTWASLGLKFSNAESGNPRPAGVGDTAYQCVIRWWSGRNVPPKYRDTVYLSANQNQKPALWTSQIVNANITASILPATIFQTCDVPAISYVPAAVIGTVGFPIVPLTPVNTGGSITGYTISPALSSGLSIGATSGLISGVPTASRALTTYQIIATGAGGSDTTTVQITVKIAPPNFHYFPVSYVLLKNHAYTISPISTGGLTTSYSISPALPSGLNFNISNAIISGTPTVSHAATTYNVTGVNTSGSYVAPLSIRVITVQPSTGPIVPGHTASPVRKPRN